MATLGKFKKENGVYEGAIESITSAPLPARISPVQTKPNSDSPDYRVYRGAAEVGAAWKKKTRAGEHYLVVALDDPAFAQPIQCRLAKSGDEYVLYWTRK
ncbi:DUF736 domain-containing protein [Rhizobium hainanense]|uniref:Uncharacterized conserved protein, DUF736 family n=1 Tax=Rhizobium hainanense TaxID=52131 RepID=A0A1C3WCW4_9HYPH|nr:DUF736 domain-containing protein [Rhizobium hainanense]SCB37715.1 Uncharacterized conserved protein, DUF736 family [Rhizobium hainanense]